MRTITLRGHFASPGFFDGPGRDFEDGAAIRRPRHDFFNRLVEIGAERMAEMDAAGIDMQVLSINSRGPSSARRTKQSRWRESPTNSLPTR